MITFPAVPTPGDYVECSKCGRIYILCPMDDYYEATTATDGICESCLIGNWKLVTVNPEDGKRLQKEYEDAQTRRSS